MEEKLLGDISNIVKKIFPSEIQSKRIIKEIQLLRELDQKFYKVALQNSVLGLKIMIDVTDICLLAYSQELKLSEKSILFEILLEPKFPFIYPKIFCRTSVELLLTIKQIQFQFTQPSIADGRDLLADILKTIWGPQVLLHQIVQKIPSFLLEISKMKESIQLQSIGKFSFSILFFKHNIRFHLGYDYNLEDFLAMDSVNVFPVKQIIQNNSQFRQKYSNKIFNKNLLQRYMIISSVNIMNFEVTDQKKGLIKLIQYSQLQNLQNIKRKKNNTKLVILLWKDPDEFKNSNNQQQMFELEDSQQLIDLIIKYMKQNGVKIIKNAIKKPDLTMDDVTGKKDFDGLNILQLMENISILESEMQVELSVNNINTLMSLYQKAIEYFSALNDETYINYINRLQELLAKPAVQAVLDNKTTQGNQEEKKQQQSEEEEKQLQKEEQQNIVQEIQQKQNNEQSQNEQKIEEQKNEEQKIKEQKIEEQKIEEQKIEEQKIEEQKIEEQKEEIKENQQQKEEIKENEQKEEQNIQNEEKKIENEEDQKEIKQIVDEEEKKE